MYCSGERLSDAADSRLQNCVAVINDWQWSTGAGTWDAAPTFFPGKGRIPNILLKYPCKKRSQFHLMVYFYKKNILA